MARKLGRTTDQRMALLRNLATDLIIHERMETTEAKAKELRSVVEKMITLGKRGDLHARRQAESFLYKPTLMKKGTKWHYKSYSLILVHAMKTVKVVTLACLS